MQDRDKVTLTELEKRRVLLYCVPKRTQDAQ
jgi:hypothetical protein